MTFTDGNDGADIDNTDPQKEQKRKLLELLNEIEQESDDRANVIIDYLKEEYNRICSEIDALLLEKRVLIKKHNEVVETLRTEQGDKKIIENDD